MYKSRAKAWVEALRSGQYPQGYGVLTRLNEPGEPASFCCLGVLCELAIADGAPVRVENYGSRAYDGETGGLPLSVRRWAGLDNGNPVIQRWTEPEPCGVCGVVHENREGGLTAAAANDTRRYDFNKIADLIEKTFLSES